MKRVLLLGATGHLGKVLTEMLLERSYAVVALVRDPGKVTITHKNLTIIKGNVTDPDDLAKALDKIDVVISTLGHGFRTAYPIQEKTVSVLLPIMKEKNISRFITITGAGLQMPGDRQTFVESFFYSLLPLIDPYRLHDASKQQMLLEKSTTEWTVVRTPIHNSRTNQKLSHVGSVQPKLWYTLSRKTISKFITDCIDERTWINKSPIIY